tara:strand:- start:326 stop:706 length:381 start_codon:yes stop_codon:yes gene_type:complete
MNLSLKYSIVLFILMFIISGFNKVVSLGDSESLRFSNKTGINQDISKYIVLLAGLIELISCLMIIYGIFNSDIFIAKYGIYSLILFTILATLIFYVFPMKYKPLLSNLSVATGLYLLLNVCEFVKM